MNQSNEYGTFCDCYVEKGDNVYCQVHGSMKEIQSLENIIAADLKIKLSQTFKILMK